MQVLLVLLASLAQGAPIQHDDPALESISTTLLRDVAASPQRRHRAVVQAADGDHLALAERIQNLVPDAVIDVSSTGLVQVTLPGSNLALLAHVPGVEDVRRPIRATTKSAVSKERTSQGAKQIFVGTHWHELGLAGDGVRVAVLDAGFAGWLDRAGKELPDSDRVHTYFWSDETVTNHGTAVAEIIHDIAPQAELALYTFETDVEYFAACDQIVDNEEVLVNASFGYDNLWPPDDTSPWTEKVNELHSHGVTWVAAAGNEADLYWIGEVRDDDGDGWLEVAGYEAFPAWTEDSYAEIRLRWDEPMGAARLDIDLLLDVDPSTGEAQCASGIDSQDGDDHPLEWAWCDTDSDQVTISLFDHSGAAAGTTVWLYNASGQMPSDLWSTEGTLTLPADASGAIAVGAWDVGSEDLAYYSSQGPTADGRLKPDLVAHSGVTTKTDGRSGFSGSSSSAPHVTAVAALLLQASGGQWQTEQLRDWMTDQALDGGPSGPDNAWGHGLLQVGEPPEGYEAHAVEYKAGCGCSGASASSGPAGWWMLLLWAPALLRRYRHSSPRR